MTLIRASLVGVLLSAACQPASSPRQVDAFVVPKPRSGGQATANPSRDPDAWRSVEPLLGNVPEMDRPKVREQALGNGFRVVVVEDHRVSLATLGVVVTSGALDEPLDQRGLAGVAASALASYPQQDGQDDRKVLTEAAAVLNVNVTYSTSSISTEVLSEDIQPIITVLAKTVQRRNPDARAIIGAIDSQKTDLAASSKKPRIRAEDGLKALIFGKHRLAAPPEGVVKELSLVKPPMVLSFIRDHWNPESMALVVIGDVSFDEVVKVAEKEFGHWRVSAVQRSDRHVREAAPREPEEHAGPGLEELVLLDDESAKQATFAAGFRVQGFGTAEWPVVLIANNLLASGPASRLGILMRRTRGYAYNVRGTAESVDGQGLLWMMASVDISKISAAVVDLQQTVAELHGVIEDAEVRSAKDYVAKQVHFLFDSNTSTYHALVEALGNKISLDAYFDALAQVRAVDFTTVQKWLQDHVRVSEMSLVIEGPQDKIGPALDSIGAKYIVR